jgi:ferrochelatase
MRYQNEFDLKHDSPLKQGVLLVNLGTPNSPQVGDVRRYLAEFLSDPRLVEMPRLIWWLILHGIILRTRPRRTAKAYQRIWKQDGSPLLTISQRQSVALQTILSQRHLKQTTVALAMRYGQPSIAAGLATLRQANVRKILILPLYPQYSATTTGSVFDAVTTELQTWRWVPEIRFINNYYNHPNYITALVNSIDHYWNEYGKPEQLLFSFHGIPKQYSLAGDPYFYHCQMTAQLVAAELQLQSTQWQIAFQSRFGTQEWLQPYLDKQLESLGRANVHKVHVVCPGFATDCLETLEEIAIENQKLFIAAGGKEYGYIPALNDRIEHIEMLANLVMEHEWK